MNNKIYTKNVEALKKKQPDFWEKLEKLEHREKNKQLKVFYHTIIY